jgi:hypothetical protein
MKVNVYEVKGQNSGELSKTDEIIDIKCDRWIQNPNGIEISHPMEEYTKKFCFSDENVYFLNFFGFGNKGNHISLNFYKTKCPFSYKVITGYNKRNLRCVVNVVFLCIHTHHS